MPGSPVEGHVEVHLTVAESHDLQLGRLGDHGEVGPPPPSDGVLGPRSCRLLVDDRVEADAAMERDPGALHGEDSRGHRGDAGLHVARPEPEQLAVSHHRLERIGRPAFARRHRVGVAVQQQRRPAGEAELCCDVRAPRMDVLEQRVDATALERAREPRVQRRPRSLAGSRSVPRRDGRADQASRRLRSRRGHVLSRSDSTAPSSRPTTTSYDRTHVVG